MRSRYSAYVRGDGAYLLRTWHPSTRPPVLDLAGVPAVKWCGLEVLRAKAGGPGDREGIVEFVARFKENGRAGRLHETSRFVREGGEWLYVDGILYSGG